MIVNERITRLLQRTEKLRFPAAEQQTVGRAGVSWSDVAIVSEVMSESEAHSSSRRLKWDAIVGASALIALVLTAWALYLQYFSVSRILTVSILEFNGADIRTPHDYSVPFKLALANDGKVDVVITEAHLLFLDNPDNPSFRGALNLNEEDLSEFPLVVKPGETRIQSFDFRTVDWVTPAGTVFEAGAQRRVAIRLKSLSRSGIPADLWLPEVVLIAPKTAEEGLKDPNHHRLYPKGIIGKRTAKFKL